MSITKIERNIAGRNFWIETGRVAKQADGSVWVGYGETVVLVATTSSLPRPGIDFFPLTVDYREMTYAAGKFPGGFFKREGRPTGKETLTARAIDRPLRSLFPAGYRNEVSIYVIVLSADEENDPDLLAMNGAAAAINISSIPFPGPLSAVRVGRIDGNFILNPTKKQATESDLDLLLSGSDEKVVMIEVEANEISEEDLAKAIEFGHEAIRELNAMQRELMEKTGKAKHDYEAIVPDKELVETIEAKFAAEIDAATQTEGKMERKTAIKAASAKVVEALSADTPEGERAARKGKVKEAFEEAANRRIRRRIVTEGKRTDGRNPKDLRAIEAEGNVLPRPHGSSLFTRGETQALVTCTLGSTSDEQKIDGLFAEEWKRFILHYNFSAFSVGETWPNRGPKRREIGHGDLAERSIRPLLPTWEDFPYTIRLVSDIMESNGSTSMATVCGGVLALMDAGVPVRNPVAGISIGMIEEKEGRKLLTDISGEEDHYGDMDFKVAGTERGITGVQLDIKMGGLDHALIRESLAQAREARMEILKVMLQAIPKPREGIKEHAPRHAMIQVPGDKIGMVIGPGGRMIREIEKVTGASVDIADDGRVTIAAPTDDALARAREWVEGLVAEPEINRVYPARVVSVKDFGAFVEFLPGQEGLVHISELSHNYVEKTEEVVKVGDEFNVKVVGIDDSGRVRLSKKATEAKPAGDGAEGRGGERDRRRREQRAAPQSKD